MTPNGSVTWRRPKGLTLGIFGLLQVIVNTTESSAQSLRIGRGIP